MKKLFYKLFFLHCIWFTASAQEIRLNGEIADFETKKPIAFVNIGIAGKNKGTVTDINGAFQLLCDNKFIADSITISHINYATTKVAIKNFKNQTIYLTPRLNQLAEIVIQNNKVRKRKVGVKSYNPLLWLSAYSDNLDIIENAQLIHMPNQQAIVKKVNMYLRAGFESDSSFIRINFYKCKEGSPSEKIVFKNIVINKKIEPGWNQIDLTEENIGLDQDFFMGVEFIPNFKNPLNVYLGCILSKGKGYSRTSSHGKWEKLQGAFTINVEIEY